MDNEKLQIALNEYRRNKKKENIMYGLLSTIGIVGFLVIWQVLVQFELIPIRNIATPIEVFNTFINKINHRDPDGNILIVNILASLQVALSGFCIAIVIGIPLGLFMGWYEPVNKFVRPIFEIVRPIPPIAWIPLIILWLGIGLKAKAFIIFFTSFVPCVINSYTGIRLTNKNLINVSKTFGASNFMIFYKIGIPSALPMIFSGIRVALSNAWSTLVAAEMLAANAGLGYMILMGRAFSRPDIVITGMIVIGAFGAIMSAILTAIEKKLLSWRISR